MKILLVEDDAEIAGHVSQALTAAGHAVESVADGHQGLSRALSGEYAALILDRMLPGLDGLSVTRELRTQGVETPILLITTMTGIVDPVEGLEGGADDYLVKPFAFAELLGAGECHGTPRRYPQNEHESLFRRFYRREASRTRPGYGLGLALVSAIAELHDAKLHTVPKPDGFSITVEFPLP